VDPDSDDSEKIARQSEHKKMSKKKDTSPLVDVAEREGRSSSGLHAGKIKTT